MIALSSQATLLLVLLLSFVPLLGGFLIGNRLRTQREKSENETHEESEDPL